MSNKCMIVDLDGTLCDTKWRQHHVQNKPKNWPAFFDGIPHDKPNEPVYQVVEAMQKAGWWIVFCSGRGEEHRAKTEAWLQKHVSFPYQNLYMRKAKDSRADYIIKLELLEQIRRDGFNPTLAIDDRDQVVKAWRSVGLTCLQCAEGNF